jgi:hypothetical protein
VIVWRNGYTLQHAVRSTGNKGELALRLQNVIYPTASQKTIQQFDKSKWQEPPIHHQHYRNHFNAVDQHNKNWYRFSYTYGINCWRTKLLLSVLTCATISAWVLYSESDQIALDVFRRELVKLKLSQQ